MLSSLPITSAEQLPPGVDKVPNAGVDELVLVLRKKKKPSLFGKLRFISNISHQRLHHLGPLLPQAGDYRHHVHLRLATELHLLHQGEGGQEGPRSTNAGAAVDDHRRLRRTGRGDLNTQTNNAFINNPFF